MRTLSLEPGDLLQVKSTDLPPGKFVKLQPQSPSFLEISDPRAVLERAFRGFSCLSKNDVFQFEYNNEVFDIKVLEIKPDTEQHAIVTMETDLEVDFATPVGYVEPERRSGTSTPRTAAGQAHGGQVHYRGSMAQAINYASIAPQATSALDGAKAVSSHFLGGGNKLSGRRGSKVPTPAAPSTPVAGQSTNVPSTATPIGRRSNGPQPLRLPTNKLFFGYTIVPVKKKDANGEPISSEEVKPKFLGQGQSLRQGKRKGSAVPTGTESGATSGIDSDAETTKKKGAKGVSAGGRTLQQ